MVCSLKRCSKGTWNVTLVFSCKVLGRNQPPACVIFEFGRGPFHEIFACSTVHYFQIVQLYYTKMHTHGTVGVQWVLLCFY